MKKCNYCESEKYVIDTTFFNFPKLEGDKNIMCIDCFCGMYKSLKDIMEYYGLNEKSTFEDCVRVANIYKGIDDE